MKVLTNTDSKFYLGYHATGIPIMLSIDKLKKGSLKLDSCFNTYSNLTDPAEWISAFSKESTKILKRYDLKPQEQNIFITTDLDPYYSSFVNYILYKLKQKQLVYKGKHTVVYCEKDKMVLGDHDRSIGQGVFIVDCRIFLEKIAESAIFDLKSKAPRHILDQLEQIKSSLPSGVYSLIKKPTVTSLNIDLLGFHKNLPITCRCGEAATIKILDDQYFIRYSDLNWKNKVERLLMRGLAHDGRPIIDLFSKPQVLNRLNQIRDWAFSRKKGLGTSYWEDPSNIIEPLSDSTIFFIIQPIYHLIKNNVLFLDSNANKYWDYIFFGGLVPELSNNCKDQDKIHEDTNMNISKLIEIRKVHLKTPIIDYYITGKDLLFNHVLFALYTFTALDLEGLNGLVFPRVISRGFLTLNGQKMSKSTGNFISGLDLINFKNDQNLSLNVEARYLQLAILGDSISDVNLELNQHKNFVKELKEVRSIYDRTKEIPYILEFIVQSNTLSNWDILDLLSIVIINNHLRTAIEACTNFEFRKVYSILRIIRKISEKSIDKATTSLIERIGKYTYAYLMNSLVKESLYSTFFLTLDKLSENIIDKLGINQNKDDLFRFQKLVDDIIVLLEKKALVPSFNKVIVSINKYKIPEALLPLLKTILRSKIHESADFDLLVHINKKSISISYK